ncbi:tail virion protein G7P-2 [Modicisalibacter tunisiensis]
MDADQFTSLWLLVYCIGLVAVFGLGAIKGGQR